MAEPRDVIVLAGSLRRGSFNRMMARALMEAAPEPLVTELVEFRDLPLYDQDLEESPPAEWLRFRQRVARADAVLFVTPEYNRSVPGGLKNALDVGSRPYGKSSWARKPAAVVSVTTGALGAFGANHHLRQSLVFLDMPAMPQPEAYIGGAPKLFDGTGRLQNEQTGEFLRQIMRAFAAWIEATRPHPTAVP
jgi:chromate reductase